MVNWNEGSNHGRLDPKAVRYGAEQADDRRLRPLDEARYLVGRAWAAVSWPVRTALRLVRRG